MSVYLVMAGECGPVKIGFAEKLSARLAKMQTDNHEKLVVLRWLDAEIADEVALHHRFRPLHIRGDWFRFHTDMMGNLGMQDLPIPVSIPVAWRKPDALSQYLSEHKTSVADFAEAIEVTSATLYRYIARDRLPRREVMDRIVRLTGGKVRPNDFFSERRAPGEAA